MSPLSLPERPKRTPIFSRFHRCLPRFLYVALLVLLALCFSATFRDGIDAQTGYSPGQPLALASGDLDEDGVPDLVCGYALDQGGRLTVYRGNVDSIYPNTPEARRRRRGAESPHPFLGVAQTVDLPVAPTFIESGDFDSDGHLDLVVANQDRHTFYVLEGNGKGELAGPELYVVPPSGGIFGRLGFSGKAGTTYPVLRMRLNSDAQDDLVFFRPGQSEPDFTLSSPAATFTVTNTFDGSLGSLRQAILDANASPGADAIVFNIVGSGVQTIALSNALPTVSEAVTIDASTQPGFAGTPLIELNGEGLGLAQGIHITGEGTVVRGLAINRFSGHGIFLIRGSRNIIEGNFIGTDPSGTLRHGNTGSGILLSDSPNNTIGGTTASARNVVSGNFLQGITLGPELDSPYPNFGLTTGNLIQGNFIGTDVTGSAAIGNDLVGVFILIAPSNQIGGAIAGARNVISGNSGIGVLISSTGRLADSTPISGPANDNLVQGNFIGTDASGSTALGNFGDGVALRGTSRSIIGGTSPSARNVISGNGANITAGFCIAASGISITGDSATENQIQGNFIGTDSAGSGNLGNFFDGVSVGFLRPACFPVPSNNTLSIKAISGNAIGGTTPGAGNVIAFNGAVDGNGVAIVGSNATNPTEANAIVRNSIYSNGKLGIDLAADSVTANDPEDIDFGPNNLQNYPVLNSALTGLFGTTIQGLLASSANTSLTIEFFSDSICDPSGNGEGRTFLGELATVTDGNGSATIQFASSVSVAPGNFITATATDSLGNTSEFSRCVQVRAEAADVAITKAASPNPAIVNSSLTYTLQVTNNGPDEATAVVVTDVLPLGVSFQSVSPANVCSGPPVNTNGTITCTIPSLAMGANVPITIVTTPTASSGTAITNTARVGSNTSDPIQTNNEASAVVQVRAEADVAITKTVSPNPVNVNSSLTYTLQVTNNGPDTATTVVVTDVLPAGVNFVSVSPASICSGPPVNTNGTVTCAIPTLTMGASVPITIVTTPTSSGSAITNTASVNSNTSDLILTNNSASALVQVNLSADLAVTTSVSGTITAPDGSTNLPGPGDVVTFLIQVRNNGPGPATDVTISTSVPVNTTFESLSVAPAWACSTPGFGGTGAIRCANPNVLAASVASFALGVRVNDNVLSGTDITGSAQVSSVTPDLVLANNSSSVNVSAGRPVPSISPASLEFGPSTAQATLDPTASSRTFTITNSGTSLLRYTLVSLLRTGPDVDNGKITSTDDRSTFQVRLIQPGQPEIAAPFGQLLTLGAGRQQQFRIVFNARIPILAGRFNGLAANQALPDTVTSRLTVSTTILSTLAIDLTGRVATPAKLIHPLDPARPALVTLVRSGSGLTVEFSIFDSNLDLSSVRYEFLNASGELVSDPVDVSVATAIRQSQLARGQGFRIEQRFDLSEEADIARVRVTIVDEAFASAESGGTAATTATFASVSAASFSEFGLAPESIVAGFGADLTRTELHASGYPLPTALGATRVRIKDGAGIEWNAPLFFVSPNQINYQLPAGISPGAATVTVVNQEGEVALDVLRVAGTYPGLFAANADASGVAAAHVLRRTIDGRESYEPVARFDQTLGKYIAVPLVPGREGDRLFLVVFGTGIRHRTSAAAVRVVIGGTDLLVLYAGPQGDYVGLDQVNVELPRSLFGRGETEIALSIEGRDANLVRIDLGGIGATETLSGGSLSLRRVRTTAVVSLPSVSLKLRASSTPQ